MPRIYRHIIPMIFMILGFTRSSYGTVFTTASVTVTGSEHQIAGQWDSGTYTVSFGSYSETVQYGQFSTAGSIASAIAAKFSQDPITEKHSKLCSAGICAHSSGAVITFQIASPAVLSPITVTALTTGNSPSTSFGATWTGWPIASALITNVLVASSGTSVPIGAAVTFTATVTPASATGVVTFNDGATTLGSVQLGGGTAFYTTASLTAGSHSITAIYSGDTNDLASTSAALTEIVTVTPTISIATSQTPTTHGTPVTFTATISSGPTGNVAFHDGSTLLGTASIVGTTATFTTSNLAAGTHAITASWGGNTYYLSATSNNITQVVNGIQLSGQPGVITIVAGTGLQGYTGDGGLATAAELEGPGGGIGIDAANNVYFCDGAYRVRKITAGTGLISTVAGNGTYGYSGDNQPAVNAEISCNALAVDAAGDIYIADLNHERIRKVSAATGIITTIAGNGTAGYSGDGGLGTNAAIELSSTPTATFPTATPLQIGVDAAGDLYFWNADEDGVPHNYDVRIVLASTGMISTFANGALGRSTSTYAAYFAVDPSGNVYLFAYDAIFKISSSSGNPSSIVAGIPGSAGHTGDGGPAVNAKVGAAFGVTDASGNIYFTDGSDFRKVNVTTGIISVVATRGSGGEGCMQQSDTIGDGCLALDAPLATYNYGLLGVDSSGNIYLADAFYIRGISAPLPTQLQPSTISLSCASITYVTSAVCSTSVSSGATGTISLAYPTASSNTNAYADPFPVGAAGQPLLTAALPVGSYSIVATYNGDDTHVPSLTTTNLIIFKATPTLTWPAPVSISHGTALTAQQLNASSSVPGSFTYSPGPGTVLPVGSTTLQVSFSASDTTDYTGPTTMSQTVTVTTSVPSVSWSNPAPIQYGTPLSATQLNATADVAGTFVYSNPVGTILLPGWQTLSVTFTPTSSNNNNSNAPVTASVQIDVTADTPAISGILPDPATIDVPVTISGQNFGTSQGSSTLTFNGIPVTASSWTNNEIKATVPAAATTGNVVVTVGQTPSNNFLLMIPKSCP